MNEVDRRITDPHWNEPFLSWYRGIFESVYIALHPFCTIPGLDPADACPSVFITKREDLPENLTIEVVKANREEKMAQYSIDWQEVQRLEKKSGIAVSWNEIKNGCGFQSFEQVNTALLTTIMAIREEFGSADDAEHMDAYCSAKQIFFPTEDTVPPLLQARVCTLLDRLNCDEVFVADEFDQNVISKQRTDLETLAPWILPEQIGFRFNKLYPSDHSFFMIIPWDSFYMAICGSRNALELAKVDELFEGFWCEENTEPNWGIRSKVDGASPTSAKHREGAGDE